MAEPAGPVLSLRGIWKNFGSLEILRGVDLDLRIGETVAILGPSGAGKSTLLHIAGLMEEPTDGDVLIEGRSVNGLAAVKRDRERLDTIGFLFQFHHLLPDFDVLENVMMPARIAKDDLRRAQARAKDLVERLGLGNRLHHRPFQLSGGEQQRAALARALMRDPRILLCDEPTGNLDEHTAEGVQALIWSEVARSRTAAIIVTHNDKLARRADRRLRLTNGTFAGGE